MKKELYSKIFKDRKVTTTASLYFLNITLTLLILNFLSNNFIIIDLEFIRILTIYLLLGLLILNFPLKKRYTGLKISYVTFIGFGLIIFSFILLIVTKIMVVWLTSIPIFLSGIDIALKGIKINRKEFYLISIFSLIYILFYILIQTIPALWHIIQRFSLIVSSSIGSLIGKSIELGPTASGLWIVIIFLIFLIVSFFLSSIKKLQLKRFLFTMAGIFVAWIIILVILAFIEFESNHDFVNLHFIVFIFCLIPTLLYMLKSNIKYESPIKLNLGRIKIKKVIKNGSIWALIFLFLSTLILTSFFGLEQSEYDEKTKVMFYGQNMLGSWDVPEYGKYGREAAGMFGLLPIYLTSSGFENIIVVNNITTFLNVNQPIHENITRYVNLTDHISFIESNEITADILQDIDIFVVTSINKSFSPNEKKVIWEYVKKGGSLLVLGDHTNVGGIQEPLNDFLKPVDISFRFDSALPVDSKFKWLTCYQLIYHPITSNIKSFDEIQISVGASLKTSSNAIPIIIGRFGLSDEGDQLNEDISYLGDYKYNRGEQLGDIILVAATYYGEGKVLVFGDTSTFQNSALPYSYSFIHNIITWLDSKQTATTKIVQIGISIALLVSALILVLINKKNSIHYAFFPFIFSLAIVVTVAINPLLIADMQISENFVYIDASHNERFNLEPFTEKSVSGLSLNLNRNGYLPIILREFSQEKIENTKIFILNAPTQSLTTDEVEFLHEYMLNGGIIIIATGYSEKGAVTNLLKKYDLDILNVPLGPFPYVEENPEEYENEPRFVDSWPIIFNEKVGQSYYNFTWNINYHLMVFVKQGKGGILLIGDNQFLLDKNIESIYDYWPGNIILLAHILNEFQAMEEQP